MKIMNLCIAVFLFATQSAMATIDTITESKKPKLPKKHAHAWDIQSSIRSTTRSVKHAAILFGLGVYIGKCKPELVDQVLREGQKIAHDGYDAISRKVSSGLKSLQELANDTKKQTEQTPTTPETFQEEDRSQGGADNERQD